LPDEIFATVYGLVAIVEAAADPKIEDGMRCILARIRRKPKMETLCGIRHISVEEAVVHAEQNLGTYHKPAEPYRGRTRLNNDVVVGFQASPARRFRLDFDQNWQQRVEDLKRGNPDWQRRFFYIDEYRGVHINEENFDAPPGRQRILHLTEASELMMDTYFRKWSAQYRPPGYKK
jgi:hypothetical protein